MEKITTTENETNEVETPEVDEQVSNLDTSATAQIAQSDEAAGESNDSTESGTETVPDEEPETFDRPYVEKLRKESAKYRERAKRADELAQRLHTALVAADGRLADPADLEFNAEHLDDPEALAAAVGDLITRKPGLRAQKLSGDVGAGQRGSKPKPPADLLSIIKGM